MSALTVGEGPSPRTADAWWRDAVIYQVYVRSFLDSTGDGIGDLAGVRAGLPYLKKLGVDGIWLSPFYPSPQHDHGYDVADYRDVDPVYGDLAEFDRLVTDARRLGMKLVLDIVPNHCSSEHPWFRDALRAPAGSAPRDRFHFADGRGPDGAEPPNNWHAMFGGPAWSRITEPDGTPGQWYLHLFTPEQPDLNWRDADVAESFDGTLRFWLDRGIDGFRIDVAAGLFKDRELPDSPDPKADERSRDSVNPLAWNQPEVHDVWRRWRAVCEEYTAEDGCDRLLVGEISVPTTREHAEYIRPDELHQAFFFDLLSAPWDADAFRKSISEALRDIADTGSTTTWVLNNHDQVRSVTRYAGEPGIDSGGPGPVRWDFEGQPAAAGACDRKTEDRPRTGRTGANPTTQRACVPGVAGPRSPTGQDLGSDRARAAALLMLALPGAAYIYQGEELGLPEVLDLPDELLTDPIFRRTGSRTGVRDGCRVPLPWSGHASPFGFTSGTEGVQPWLPQPDWFAAHATDRALSDPRSFWHLYREALQLRRGLPQLGGGTMRWLESSPDVLAFARGDGLVCAVNFGTSPVDAPVPATLLLASGPCTGPVLPGSTAAWWISDRTAP
ncbi:glycoside hydrolase family 13 protein [Streptomyces sp. N2-109]|uniref:Glycoside hydrolase family 13 protein n=1 Tax=Streptomyces gossypii TaxID=2883101 RepID=A0ABT2JVE7_9ACTN|nr:glycoside hydrolase family 13 protein [Streptomyces gossypii]MCT2591310.1 glycoside hydrolase family 13 protein [Streptomyces gossypii]